MAARTVASLASGDCTRRVVLDAGLGMTAERSPGAGMFVGGSPDDLSEKAP
jgi:hypothetical protein